MIASIDQRFTVVTVLAFLACNHAVSDVPKSADAVCYVQCINWNAFPSPGSPSAELKLSTELLENAARHSLQWAENEFQSSENGDRYLIKNENVEHTIRPVTSAAYGMAVVLKTGVVLDVPTAVATQRTLSLIKGAASIHKANGGNWGDHWQSSLWSAQLARAAWMLWDELDAETRQMVAKLVVHEANRNYKVRYWNGKGGDSKAEENSWDSMILQVAVAMMPTHPNSNAWKKKCSALLVGSYCRPSDRKRADIFLDGKTPSAWLAGYNIREDGIVINHDLIHNDYMSSIAHLQMQGFMVFPMVGKPVPESLDFNFDLIYRTLTTKRFDSPPFKEPGGTMFIPGSAEQYYPKGTDWSKYRYACYYGMDTLADVLGYEKDLPHKASAWRRLRGERMLEMQSRHTDGRMYAPGEYENYKGVEQMVFWMMADAHFLQWLEDHGASFEKANWLEDETAAAKPKNVLLICVDDLRPELGCYGAEHIKTPHMDQLATEGILFERAYCNIPVCGASRASLMTGILPTPERFRQYDARADEDTPNAKTLPQVFKEAGCQTFSAGKVFHDQEDCDEASWSEAAWHPEDSYRSSHDPATLEKLSKKGRGRIYEMPDVADDVYPDGQIADKTIANLRRMKESGQPFFVACGFIRPHLPFYAPKKYWDLYDRETLPLADNRFRPQNAPKGLYSGGEYKNYHLAGMNVKSDAFHRMMRHGYFASVSYTDQLVGNVLEELTALGLADDTIVVLWGDHGWNLGEHTFWGKHNMAHNSLQVPLLVKVPGVETAKTRALVESVDLFPTLCELAGLSVPASVQGKSFMSVIDQPDASFKDHIYTRFLSGDTVVTKRYAFTRYTGKNPGVMLYDHKTDPKENINVAANPENKQIVEAMEKLLDESIERAAEYK